jgi:HAD superfamily hydrolase (TIGR01509 family)
MLEGSGCLLAREMTHPVTGCAGRFVAWPRAVQKRVTAVLFDVDGTLVDSNDAHCSAWVKAFWEYGLTVDPIAVRQRIGMGGDKLMPAVSGIQEDSPLGKLIAKRRAEIFRREQLPRLKPFNGAKDLVAAIKDRGCTAVAASSAKEEELKPLLAIAGVDSLMDGKTSSDDARESKPDPDIIEAALERAHADPSEAIMIGDTPYDIEAATRAGMRTIAFRSGGWRDSDLDGAIAIYDGPWDLLARIDESPLRRS